MDYKRYLILVYQNVQPWIRSTEPFGDHLYKKGNNNVLKYFSEHEIVNISSRLYKTLGNDRQAYNNSDQ